MTNFWTALLYLCVLNHGDPSTAITSWGKENMIREVTRSKFPLRVREWGLIISGDMKYNTVFLSFRTELGNGPVIMKCEIF